MRLWGEDPLDTPRDSLAASPRVSTFRVRKEKRLIGTWLEQLTGQGGDVCPHLEDPEPGGTETASRVSALDFHGMASS